MTLSQEGITAARNAVSYHFGDKFLSAEEPKQYATKTAGAQGSPRGVFARRLALPRPGRAGFQTSRRPAAPSYADLAARTLACQMIDATGSTATVRLSAPAGPTEGEAVFQASGTVIEFPGFMKATGEGASQGRRSGAGAGSDQAAAAGKTDAKAVGGDASNPTPPAADERRPAGRGKRHRTGRP